MSIILRACGVVLIGLSASLLLRERHKSLALLCSLSAAVVIFLWCGESGAAESVIQIGSAVSETGFSEYVKVLLKALGIAYAATLTSEICKSAGDNLLSGAAVLCGKLLLIILCLPLVSELLEVAASAL